MEGSTSHDRIVWVRLFPSRGPAGSDAGAPFWSANFIDATGVAMEVVVVVHGPVTGILATRGIIDIATEAPVVGVAVEGDVIAKSVIVGWTRATIDVFYFY